MQHGLEAVRLDRQPLTRRERSRHGRQATPPPGRLSRPRHFPPGRQRLLRHDAVPGDAHGADPGLPAGRAADDLWCGDAGGHVQRRSAGPRPAADGADGPGHLRLLHAVLDPARPDPGHAVLALARAAARRHLHHLASGDHAGQRLAGQLAVWRAGHLVGAVGQAVPHLGGYRLRHPHRGTAQDLSLGRDCWTSWCSSLPEQRPHPPARPETPPPLGTSSTSSMMELPGSTLDELVLVPPRFPTLLPARKRRSPLGTSSTSSMMEFPAECAPPSRVLSAHPARRISHMPITTRMRIGATTAISGEKPNTRLDGPSRSWRMRKLKPTSTPVNTRWPSVTERSGPKMKEMATNTSAAVVTGCSSFFQKASQYWLLFSP